MAAVDSSTIIDFLAGIASRDTEKFDAALASASVRIPPAAIVEVLSYPGITAEQAELVDAMPVLEVLPGYWHRAAATRREILSRGLRARLADTLIAQSCLDYDEELIAGDNDFRHFAKHCGLKLA